MEQPSPDASASATSGRKILEKEQSQLAHANSVLRFRIDPTIHDFQLGISAHAENLNPLNRFYRLDERISGIVEHKKSNPPSLDLFSTTTFPFHLDRRDQNLLFHCKLLSMPLSQPYVCLISSR
jgi:hypothetical protein